MPLLFAYGGPMEQIRNNAKNLRKNMTKEERHLWYDYLRDYPIRIRRQSVIGPYIVDFYCAAAKLVVELDGSQHYEEASQAYDKARTEYLELLGIHVIRIPNNEVMRNFRGVCEYIDANIQERLRK